MHNKVSNLFTRHQPTFLERLQAYVARWGGAHNSHCSWRAVLHCQLTHIAFAILLILIAYCLLTGKCPKTFCCKFCKSLCNRFHCASAAVAAHDDDDTAPKEPAKPTKSKGPKQK